MAVLRRALLGECGPSCAAALEVVARRDLVARFEPELVGLVSDVDRLVPSHLGARIIRILARGPTARSVSAIVNALESTDVALQAAALEAGIDPKASAPVRTGSELVAGTLLEQLAHSSDARVRRSALMALRARSDSRLQQVISDLLEDKSVEHRLSALEVMRYTDDNKIRSRVLRMLEGEPTQEFASRGRTVLRFLRVRRKGLVEVKQESGS
jgi:HEAT repeat protein